MIFLSVHGISLQISSKNSALLDSIKEYYQIFLSDNLDWAPDIIIDLEMYGYFEKKQEVLVPSPTSARVGDNIWIEKEKREYFFVDKEISTKITWNEAGSMCIRAQMKPLPIRHWVNIALQWTTRISKYYSRFFIKTCIHDPLFLLLEKKFGIILLHATSVTDGEKTFVFTGLGGSGKSTTAAMFSKELSYTILSDNYALIKWNTLYPFPELPRITKQTEQLLGIKLDKKADGIKSYLENDTKDIREVYKISAIYICSYGQAFEKKPLKDVNLSFEQLQSINHYTQEFPEYRNLALLTLLSEYTTWVIRAEELKNICQKNRIYSLQNDKNILSHIEDLTTF